MFSNKNKRHVSGAFAYIAIAMTATLLFSEAGGETNTTAVNTKPTAGNDLGGKNKTKGFGFFYITRPILFTLDAIGASCNFLLVMVLLIDPLKRLRKGAWITILNLAMADFTACVSNFLKRAYPEFDVLRKQLSNKISTVLIYGVFWAAALAASFMLLTLLTIQIYVIIKWPVRSRALLTAPRIAVLCGVAWFLAFLLAIGNFSYMRVSYFFEIFIVYMGVLEFVIVIQVVVKILIIREIVRSRLRSVANPENHHYRTRKMAKTVMMLNTVFLLTAVPYFAGKQYETYQKSKREPGTEFPYYYEPIAVVNFVVNPILYSLRLPDFRHSLIALFCNTLCLKRRAAKKRPFIVQGTHPAQSYDGL